MKPYRLAARDGKDTIIEIVGRNGAGTCLIGEGFCTIIAGPCAVESEEGILSAALWLRRWEHISCGEAPLSLVHPHTLSGLGLEGLNYLALARKETGLPIITEVLDVRDIDQVLEVADICRVGSRNMHNYPCAGLAAEGSGTVETRVCGHGGRMVAGG